MTRGTAYIEVSGVRRFRRRVVSEPIIACVRFSMRQSGVSLLSSVRDQLLRAFGLHPPYN